MSSRELSHDLCLFKENGKKRKNSEKKCRFRVDFDDRQTRSQKKLFKLKKKDSTMCGITACLYSKRCEKELRELALKSSRAQQHRGPDFAGIKMCAASEHLHCLAHERLMIVGESSGEQPLVDEDGQTVLTVNGEIYNHAELRGELEKLGHRFLTGSDCEVVLHGYKAWGADIVSRLDGQFAFVLVDLVADRFLAARDPIGIAPMYWGRDVDGALWFCSELKGLIDRVSVVREFVPGTLLCGSADVDTDADVRRYFEPAWIDDDDVDEARRQPIAGTAVYDDAALRRHLIDAVEKRLMCEVPWGVLLSGGLDSSLVASIAARACKRSTMSRNKASSSSSSSSSSDTASPLPWTAPGGCIHTFSIGLSDSPDLVAAARVAKHIGSRHHEFVFTVEQGLDALDKVIEHTESFDVTTVRASTPMFLLSRRIKALGVKTVLSGEGADEAFGGYAYYRHAPSGDEFHRENVRQLKDLHRHDCLRANKSTMAWGVEARAPFLDAALLDYVMTLAPEQKMSTPERIEKWILRNAFASDGDHEYLPDDVLWRSKEQFSDGVGFTWVDSLKARADAIVSDHQLRSAAHRWPANPPLTKEAYLYREIYDRHYGSRNPSVVELVPSGPSIACSTPVAMRWRADFLQRADPSGRSIYQQCFMNDGEVHDECDASGGASEAS
jgi:asparagine synthase (glutamine-hydrolysing)